MSVGIGVVVAADILIYSYTTLAVATADVFVCRAMVIREGLIQDQILHCRWPDIVTDVI